VNELEKIDVIRGRAGVSYREAKEALARSDGDVLEALICLEEGEAPGTAEVLRVRGSELVNQILRLIREGNVRRVIVSRRGRTLLDIPVTVGAAGAVLLPYITAAGTLAAVLTECSITVERRKPAGVENGDEEEPPEEE